MKLSRPERGAGVTVRLLQLSRVTGTRHADGERAQKPGCRTNGFFNRLHFGRSHDNGFAWRPVMNILMAQTTTERPDSEATRLSPHFSRNDDGSYAAAYRNLRLKSAFQPIFSFAHPQPVG